MRARGQTTISSAMALIATVAVSCSSVLTADSLADDLLILSLLFLLPAYLLVNLRRGLSGVQMAGAALAAIYLGLGASLRFWPGAPPYHWQPIYSLYGVSWGVGYSLGLRNSRLPWGSHEVIRWNWGLLAVFYAFILVVSARQRLRRRPTRAELDSGRIQGQSDANRTWSRFLPNGVELVPAMWFLCNWYHGSCPIPEWPYGACPIGAPWSGALCLLGLAGSLLLVFAEWRPRPSWWRPWRIAAGVARLAPPAVAGIIAGLVYSLSGKAGVLAAAVLSVAVVGLVARPARWRKRWIALIYLLAMFWGFAIATQVALPTLPKISVTQ